MNGSGHRLTRAVARILVGSGRVPDSLLGTVDCSLTREANVRTALPGNSPTAHSPMTWMCSTDATTRLVAIPPIFSSERKATTTWIGTQRGGKREGNAWVTL